MKIILCIALIVVYVQGNNYNIGRGAQVRLTHRGFNYAASIGVQKLQQELRNKRLDSVSGRKSDIQFSASNINIQYMRIPTYSIQTVANSGIRLSVSGVSVSASGKISASFKKGWFKVGDSTNVRISGSRIGFTLNFRFAAQNGKPQVTTSSCSASIGGLDLDFNGGLSWVYNAISSLFSGKVKDILKKVICDEGKKLINKEANYFFSKFPTRKNLDGYTIIDYSLQSPVTTNNYLDLLLRGEFLNPSNPRYGPESPPSFNTVSSSSKMVYVWLTDFTLNSAGKVLHETGLLQKVLSPTIMNEIPQELKPFLNTKSFEQIIPQLYQMYPDKPLEFDVQTLNAPTFNLSAGKGEMMLSVRANVAVDNNGTKQPLFYLDISVTASGSVSVKTVNDQLNVGGNIVGFNFGLKVGGSNIGSLNIPTDDPSVEQFIKGLVIGNANPILNKGFPIPNIRDLNFINPAVTFVERAIRVDTDIRYSA